MCNECFSFSRRILLLLSIIFTRLTSKSEEINGLLLLSLPFVCFPVLFHCYPHFSLSLSLSLSLSHTHTYTHTTILTCSISFSLYQTHYCTFLFTCSHCLMPASDLWNLCHTHTPSLSHFLTHYGYTHHTSLSLYFTYTHQYNIPHFQYKTHTFSLLHNSFPHLHRNSLSHFLILYHINSFSLM